MKRPLLRIAAAVCAGIWCDECVPAHAGYAWGALAVCCVIVGRMRSDVRPGDWMALALAVCFGTALAENSLFLPADHAARFVRRAAQEFTSVRGTVVSQTRRAPGAASFILRAQEIYMGREGRRCRGDILVRVPGEFYVVYGERVVVRGILRVVPSSGFRSFDSGLGASFRPQASVFRPRRQHERFADYLRNEGIHAIMAAASPLNVVREGEQPGFSVRRCAVRFKGRLTAAIEEFLPPVPAGFTKAMLVGDSGGIPKVVEKSMMLTGTVHILVVSGTHVALVASLLVLLMKIMRIPRVPRLMLALPCLVFYCLMTGTAPPVVRSTVMALVMMGSYVVRREHDVYSACAAAALIILIWNPRQLFQLGFQLSFASVLSIVFFYPRLKKMLRLDAVGIRWARYLCDGAVVSLSAWIGTMGIIAFSCKMWSPVTVFANLIMVPLAAAITLSGFCLLAAAAAAPVAAPYCASVIEVLVIIMIKVNDFFVHLPGAYVYLPGR